MEQSTHEALKSLDWLEGTWRSKPLNKCNQTIKDFDYCEEMSFKSIGEHMFNFTEQTFSNWDLEEPMHREEGFMKVDPKTNKVIFISSYNSGLTTVEYGTLNKKRIMLKTTISEATNPDEKQELLRKFDFDDKNGLAYMYYIISSTVPVRVKIFEIKFVKVSEEAKGCEEEGNK